MTIDGNSNLQEGTNITGNEISAAIFDLKTEDYWKIHISERLPKTSGKQTLSSWFTFFNFTTNKYTFCIKLWY